MIANVRRLDTSRSSSVEAEGSATLGRSVGGGPNQPFVDEKPRMTMSKGAEASAATIAKIAVSRRRTGSSSAVKGTCNLYIVSRGVR